MGFCSSVLDVRKGCNTVHMQCIYVNSSATLWEMLWKPTVSGIHTTLSEMTFEPIIIL